MRAGRRHDLETPAADHSARPLPHRRVLTAVTPCEALADALGAAGNDLAAGDQRHATLAEVLERLSSQSHASATELGGWLARCAADEPRRGELTDLVGLAARRLTSSRDEHPSDGVRADAWRALVTALDGLHGSGTVALGQPAFITPALLDALVREAHEALPVRPDDGERSYAPAGPVLARLAVSRQLREALSMAAGVAVATTYEAVYAYDPPGSHVRTHVDHDAYELTFHLVLEHALAADITKGSALVTHEPDDSRPGHLRLAPGEGVLLNGRGTLHAWERLRSDERRTLIAIGFARARRPTHGGPSPRIGVANDQLARCSPTCGAAPNQRSERPMTQSPKPADSPKVMADDSPAREDHVPTAAQLRDRPAEGQDVRGGAGIAKREDQKK